MKFGLDLDNSQDSLERMFSMLMWYRQTNCNFYKSFLLAIDRVITGHDITTIGGTLLANAFFFSILSMCWDGDSHYLLSNKQPQGKVADCDSWGGDCGPHECGDSSGLHRNALASSLKRKVLETNGCLRVLGWLYIILSFFFTPGVMQLFYGEQLTANYLLNREVNTLELVRWTEGEGGKLDTTVEKCTHAFSHWPGKCDRDWLWDCASVVTGLVALMGVSGFSICSHYILG